MNTTGNPKAYCAANPVNWRDPHGLNTNPAPGIAMAAASAVRGYLSSIEDLLGGILQGTLGGGAGALGGESEGDDGGETGDGGGGTPGGFKGPPGGVIPPGGQGPAGGGTPPGSNELGGPLVNPDGSVNPFAGQSMRSFPSGHVPPTTKEYVGQTMNDWVDNDPAAAALRAAAAVPAIRPCADTAINIAGDVVIGAAASVAAVDVAVASGVGKLSVNYFSKGNIFKIVSRRLKMGLRIDPAHHGMPWGHRHFGPFNRSWGNW